MVLSCYRVDGTALSQCLIGEGCSGRRRELLRLGLRLRWRQGKEVGVEYDTARPFVLQQAQRTESSKVRLATGQDWRQSHTAEAEHIEAGVKHIEGGGAYALDVAMLVSSARTLGRRRRG